MGYPRFPGKYKESALFTPEDFLQQYTITREVREALPRTYLLIYSPALLRRFQRAYKPRRIRLPGRLTVYAHRGIGVVRFEGIGAPHAVSVVEELIALGGREFIVIGTAGGLKRFGVFVCDRALRDEGTSYHYAPDSPFAYPDEKLTHWLETCLERYEIQFERGASWTIDAPYRETRAEVEYYREEGILTVEMEASALFTLGRVRNVRVAAVFTVSDLLQSEGWDPQFDARHVKRQLARIFDAVLTCLLKEEKHASQ